MSAVVEIFTRPGCGYCTSAKSLLSRKNVEFIELNAGIDPAHRQAMLARANGRTTFPQIFIDGFHVGGCDDLYALEHAGQLEPLLQREEDIA